MKMDALSTRIKYWIEKYQVYKSWFDSKPIKGLIDFVAIIQKAEYKFDEEVMYDFIDGLALLRYSLKNPQNTEAGITVDSLVNPVIEIIISLVKSNRYLQKLLELYVEGDESFDVNGVKVPITIFKLKQFIKNTKAIPLTGDDIENLKTDYADYRKNVAAKAKSKRKVDSFIQVLISCSRVFPSINT